MLSFQSGETSLHFSFSPLDSDSLSTNVYSLHIDSEAAAHPSTKGVLRQWLLGLDRSLGSKTVLTARIKSGDPLIHMLQEAGFYFTELTIHPELSNLQQLEITQTEYSVMKATPQQIFSLAGGPPLFGVSRFHSDARISNELADKRFHEWLVRALHSDDQDCISVVNKESGAELAIFVIRRQNEESFWALTAVMPEFQGRGMAKGIWNAVLSYEQSLGVTRVRTNISAENTRTIPVYVKAGFLLSRTSVCLHIHLGSSAQM